MKTFRFMLAFFAAVTAARADDITLTDGRTFAGAKITTQTPTHVTVRHQGGFQQVPKKLLPHDLAVKYPIDEAAAAELAKKDAQFKDARIKAVKENDAKRQEAAAAQRAHAATMEREQQQAMADAEVSGAVAEKVVSAKFNVYPVGKNSAVGLSGVRVFFCTPEQWATYQEARRIKHEDEYKRHCAIIQAQGYDRDGYSAAYNDEWLRFRRWLRSSYEEIPEHFANAKTNYKGAIVVPVMQRPFVMFARSERSEGEGWDRYVWVSESSGFEAGVQKVFSPGSSVKEEPWAKLPRRTPLTTNVESD